MVAAIAIGMTSEYWWEVLKKLVMKQRKFFEEAGEEAAAEILADLFKPLFVGGVAFLSANVYGLFTGHTVGLPGAPSEPYVFNIDHIIQARL